jgi:o-succinylbenzoate---CoA ligase
VPGLVAVETDDGFVAGLRRAWDRGDAVLPLDHRLPAPARGQVLRHLRARDAVEDGDALVVATSGSTGEPKGVVLTHDAVRASARAGNAALGVDPAAGDEWLACLPLSHLGGLGVVTKAVLTGTPLTVQTTFDAAAVASAAVEMSARGHQALTTLVPTAFARIDPRLFRAIVLGGAPVPGALPSNVVTSYGLTETCGGCVYDGLPFEGVEIRLARDGQILVRGPVLLRAYRDGTDPKTADGWLPTGDAGSRDGKGRLRVDGRLTDLIISGGENVWPAAIERVLRQHPRVGEVAVGGRPDPEWGERVVAWVIAARVSDPPTLEDLRSLVKAHLPAPAAPRELVLVDDLPRTPSGKVRPPGEREPNRSGGSQLRKRSR